MRLWDKEEKNKNYTLKLRATDKAGNVSGDDDYKFDFTVNNDKPVIKIISIAPQITHEGKETVNGIVKVKASLSDTNSIVSAYYTCDSSLQDNVDWAASGKATAFNPQEIANGIEISVDTTTKFAPPIRTALWIWAEIWLINVMNVWFQSFCV